MSIGISDEHVELAASLRKWAAGARGRRGRRGAAEDDADGALRRRLEGRRRDGRRRRSALPEAAGGGGGTVLDQAVALEACAHELVPGPLLGAAVAAALLGETERRPESATAPVALALGPASTSCGTCPAPPTCSARTPTAPGGSCPPTRSP